MKHLNGSRYVQVLSGVFVLCFLGFALLGNDKVNDPWSALTVGSKALSIVVFIAGFFVTYAWKWKIFRGWLVPFPDLNGTWIGFTQSDWIDKTTGKVIGPIPTMATIKQTFIHVSCVIQTGESKSHSFAPGFWIDDDEQIFRIVYSYHNKPTNAVVHRSAAHSGTAILDIIDAPKKLKGEYFTGRKTAGTIELTFHSKERLQEMPTSMGRHPMSP